MGALTALLGSEEAADLPQDLLVLNFGLHYNGRNLSGQLDDDLQNLRSFIVSHKVSPHIAMIGMPFSPRSAAPRLPVTSSAMQQRYPGRLARDAPAVLWPVNCSQHSYWLSTF